MILTASRTELEPDAFLAREGEVFVVFDSATQDSGNVSYGVGVAGRRFFVKSAGLREHDENVLPHAERVGLLRNAVRLHRMVSHPVLPALRNVVESPGGPLLVYDWVDGELLGVPRARRHDPSSPFVRFRGLPVVRILAVLDAIFNLHNQLAADGWIAVDFYDGCLIYDFEREVLHVVDLDNYHAGPFVNNMGRMFGSTRFMAPEEFELGAEIDQRTTVFTLGRTVFELLSDGTDRPAAFRGPAQLLTVARRACEPSRHDRFDSIADFRNTWFAARGELR